MLQLCMGTPMPFFVFALERSSQKTVDLVQVYSEIVLSGKICTDVV